MESDKNHSITLEELYGTSKNVWWYTSFIVNVIELSNKNENGNILSSVISVVHNCVWHFSSAVQFKVVVSNSYFWVGNLKGLGHQKLQLFEKKNNVTEIK